MSRFGGGSLQPFPYALDTQTPPVNASTLTSLVLVSLADEQPAATATRLAAAPSLFFQSNMIFESPFATLRSPFGVSTDGRGS
jgi:hypothetical protein